MQVEMQVEKGINFAERYLEALEELFPQFTMFGLVGSASFWRRPALSSGLSSEAASRSASILTTR